MDIKLKRQIVDKIHKSDNSALLEVIAGLLQIKTDKHYHEKSKKQLLNVNK